MGGSYSEAEARRRESKLRHDLARQSWSPTDHPSWLTKDFYANEIQLRLKGANPVEQLSIDLRTNWLHQIASKAVTSGCIDIVARMQSVLRPLIL